MLGGGQRKPTTIETEHERSVEGWWPEKAHNPRNRALVLDFGGGRGLLVSGGFESSFWVPNTSGGGGGFLLSSLHWGVFLLYDI